MYETTLESRTTVPSSLANAHCLQYPGAVPSAAVALLHVGLRSNKMMYVCVAGTCSWYSRLISPSPQSGRLAKGAAWQSNRWTWYLQKMYAIDMIIVDARDT